MSKLDLVTREEFDVQTAVLAKTRKKVEALEKLVAELEKHSTGTAKAKVDGKSKKKPAEG